ncbi:hypothetical protein B7486_72050, partial [cyanobacterium TDX16]
PGDPTPLVASIEATPDEVAAGDRLAVEVRIENRGAREIDIACNVQLTAQVVPVGERLDPDEMFWPLACAIGDVPLDPGASIIRQVEAGAVDHGDGEGEPRPLLPGDYHLAFAASDPEVLTVPEPVLVTVT